MGIYSKLLIEKNLRQYNAIIKEKGLQRYIIIADRSIPIYMSNEIVDEETLYDVSKNIADVVEDIREEVFLKLSHKRDYRIKGE